MTLHIQRERIYNYAMLSGKHSYTRRRIPSMKILRLILGDQLTKNISSLHDFDKKQDVILMCEVWEEATYVRHHQKKIAFIFSAMRHFSKMLLKEKFNVVYIKLNQKNHETSFLVKSLKQQRKSRLKNW